ncbi:MAG: hypothetical protein LBO08_01195 [Rickettsiales bacterium]|jgi:hypothetical protein|nr:hypothetical protein [Rickettsiales bacterium]
MQYKKNQMSTGLMIQRCHRWRQKRKQYLDSARQTNDEVERERLLQMAEHYGRIVSDEQGVIDNRRDPKDNNKNAAAEDNYSSMDDDDEIPDFREVIGK